MNVIAECDIDTPVNHVDLAHELTLRVCRQWRHTGSGAIGRRHAGVIVGIDDRGLGAGSHIERLSDLGPDRVGLVSRHGDRGEDTDNRDDDHQLDQRESPTLAQHIGLPLGRHLGIVLQRQKKSPGQAGAFRLLA